MGFRRLRNSEKGSIPVLVALSLTVLFGFTALAMDFGMMAACKQNMQNAADASALAAAGDLASGSDHSVYSTANTYATINGFDPTTADTSMEVQTVRNTVTVTLRREMQMGFSSVLTGVRSRTVSASATAEAITIFGGCPYALFAGQRIEESGTGISVTGNNIQINGNIHSNSDINMQHAVLSPGSVATAVRDVNPAANGWHGNSIALDMPSFSSFETAMNSMPGYVMLDGDITIKKNEGGFAALVQMALDQFEVLGGSTQTLYTKGLCIHITGSLTFLGNGSSTYYADFPITLVAEGSIDLNGASMESCGDSPLYIMSRNGDITVNGGGATLTGILFAPNGNVTLNGNDAVFVGQIVAQNIRKAGGKITVTYWDAVDRYLPTTKVHLIA